MEAHDGSLLGTLKYGVDSQPPTRTIAATLRHYLLRSRSDPCYFNDKVLCRSPYWRAQREWAMALVDHRIVAVESGNGLVAGVELATASEPPARQPRIWGCRPSGVDSNHP